MQIHEEARKALVDLHAGIDIGRPNERLRGSLKASDKEGGTTNTRLMGAALWLKWSFDFGTLEDRLDSTERAQELMDRQAENGFMNFGRGGGCEQFCPSPHFEFYLIAMSTLYDTAAKYFLNGLREACARWVASAHFYLEKTYNDSADFYLMPGLRWKGKPVISRLEIFNDFMDSMRGEYSPRKNDFEHVKISLRITNKFLRNENTKPPLKLSMPLSIYRNGGEGMVVTIEKPSNPKQKSYQPINAIHSGKSGVRFEKNWDGSITNALSSSSYERTFYSGDL